MTTKFVTFPLPQVKILFNRREKKMKEKRHAGENKTRKKKDEYEVS